MGRPMRWASAACCGEGDSVQAERTSLFLICLREGVVELVELQLDWKDD